MFYFLSKVLYAFIAPVSLIIILFLFFIFTKIRTYFWWGFGLLVFFTNPWIAQSVMGLYEVEPIALNKKNQYDAIIIPSGFVTNFNVDGQLRVVFNDGNDRMLQSIDLFKRGISNRIIYTGGADTIFSTYKPEAELGKIFMVKCGIPDSAILIETRSINTYQNAAFTAKMLEKSDPDFKSKKYLLVTAGFHMRRALACFEKQGFNVDGYTTDIRSIRSKDTVLNTLLPSYGGLQVWTYLIKEWVGLLVYQMKDYI